MGAMTGSAKGRGADGPFRVAAVQMCGGRDVAGNVEEASRLVRAAAADGARYVQTPEITNVVEKGRERIRARVGDEGDDAALAAFRALAAELRIHLHVGSLALRSGEGLANRGFLIGPDGAIRARYDKIHMFDVDLPGGESWRESDSFAPGGRGVVAPVGPFVLGLSICYDLRFPALYAALAEAGATLLSVPAAFTRQTGEAHWHSLIRARAIENGACLVAATQGGTHEDGRTTYGHALIVDPWGRVLAEGGEGPGVIAADLDPAAVAEARGRIPSLANRRPFTVVRAGEGAPEPALS